ncbi:flagellar assembly protein A [Chitinivibrio alkaliphilus]|uniref:Flagellar Assembly Protein A N-terminal region domain-containing protein n=1 Tax=Chitinivibrio alkaliphilus ACht1 TaxID=1313304 RepID=U7D792_9BACT|nr:flagellar assembly protein A [Chitinivibrio alkaliphilus]ERP31436.1 hypothetical protein CALK_1637 [Chitinivibrio alkaliphilus ACht1]
MNLSTQIRIEVSKDATRSYLVDFPGDAMVDDVYRRLQDLHIVHGIIDENISQVLMGKPFTAYPIAETENRDRAVSFPHTTEGVSADKMFHYCMSIRTSILHKEVPHVSHTPRFYQVGEEVFSVLLYTEESDLYGRPLWPEPPQRLFATDGSLEMHEEGDRLRFFAVTPGYLAAEEQGRISLLLPFEDREEKLKRYCVILPNTLGAEKLYEYLQEQRDSFVAEYEVDSPPFISSEAFQSIVRGEQVKTVLVYRGKAKKDGCDGGIRFTVEEEHSKEVLPSHERVDMKSFCSYLMVKQGEIVAEKSALFCG